MLYRALVLYINYDGRVKCNVLQELIFILCACMRSILLYFSIHVHVYVAL